MALALKIYPQKSYGYTQRSKIARKSLEMPLEMRSELDKTNKDPRVPKVRLVDKKRVRLAAHPNPNRETILIGQKPLSLTNNASNSAKDAGRHF